MAACLDCGGTECICRATQMLEDRERVIIELWHNLVRMHGYIEAAYGRLDDHRPGVLRRADTLLSTSRGRVTAVLPRTKWRQMEPIAEPEKDASS